MNKHEDHENVLRVIASLPLLDRVALVRRFAAEFARRFIETCVADMHNVAVSLGDEFGEAFTKGVDDYKEEYRKVRVYCLSLPLPYVGK